MLVYARVCNKDAIKSLDRPRERPDPPPVQASEIVPPPRAMEAVTSLNAAHVKACKEHAERSVSWVYASSP